MRRPLPGIVFVLIGLLGLAGCTPPAATADINQEAEEFLELYTSMMLGIYYVAAEAQWDASIDVTPEHDGARTAAGKAYAKIQGDRKTIETARRFLEQKDKLEPVVVRQLEEILLNAAEAPGTIPEIVAARVEAEGRQSSTLDSYTFCLDRRGDGCRQPVTANDIDRTLSRSQNLDERLQYWNASKEIGGELRDGLMELRDLRNQVAREMGHESFFHLQVADYGMTVDEMMAMLEGWVDETRPLFEQLHCYTKHQLAERYGEPVPERIPAHWLGNRWGQSWPGIVDGIDLDPLFADRSAEWVVEQSEAFYTSMGFDALPQVFWDKSDLYPLPAGSERKKNTHASAWHLDLRDDVRSLMSVEPNSRWFGTSHHELGHIYYYMAYTRPEVPPLLRGGANRGFHEGIGELIAIASKQMPYLREVGVLPADQEIDQTKWLLDEALTETLAFIPWSAGVMSFWERDLYAEDLPPEQWNQRWWEYVARFQGIDPPSSRPDEGCDACTKTHINDDPAQYYDYAVAAVLKYQLHDRIASKILQQDPHQANYFGSTETGDFLKSILDKGKTQDWRTLLQETTGEGLSARAMMEYFKPLQAFLEEANAGRECAF